MVEETGTSRGKIRENREEEREEEKLREKNRQIPEGESLKERKSEDSIDIFLDNAPTTALAALYGYFNSLTEIQEIK